MFSYLDPWAIRPKRDWAIVRQDQRKSILASGLIVPYEMNAEQLHEGSGIIIRLGAGPKVSALDLKETDRVMYRTYLRHALSIEVQQRWVDGTRMEFFFIDVSDITAVIGPEVEVGAFSERKSA